LVLTLALSLQKFVSCTQISLPRPLDDLLAHTPALSVQAGLEALSKALRREPVPKILLVEARLAVTGGIALLRPVSRRVRSERLVDEDKLAVDEPELEFRVCDDESSRSRVLRCGCVQLDGDGGNLVI
jgi:hypothetical protein